ncbi:hypothetical protein [Gordonia paraffinivorans]|uniref:hypothetical protein n=1 Tax=Gordonia paraffinivorans TaxID=175628 RepID=UPI0011B25F75|nr:hypothetical protein [Gordonia paraffinivorans]
MSTSANGLEAMMRQREKRTRVRPMPPAKHPAPKPTEPSPAQLMADPDAQKTKNEGRTSAAPAEPDATAAGNRSSDPAPVADTSAPSRPTAKPVVPKARKKATAPTAAAPSATTTKGRTVGPSTIYFDEATDDFLEEVCIAGRRSKPRIDSRSAIARYAMRKLMAEMSPEEVIAAIRAESEAAGLSQGKPGRPRHF